MPPIPPSSRALRRRGRHADPPLLPSSTAAAAAAAAPAPRRRAAALRSGVVLLLAGLLLLAGRAHGQLDIGVGIIHANIAPVQQLADTIQVPGLDRIEQRSHVSRFRVGLHDRRKLRSVLRLGRRHQAI